MSSDLEDLQKKRKSLCNGVRRALKKIQSVSMASAEEEIQVKDESFTVKASFSTKGELLGFITSEKKVGVALTELVEVIQGVTWGGRGAEKIFDLAAEDVKKYKLEGNVIHKRIGGRDIKRWKISWKERYLLFPYIKSGEEWIRAFTIPPRNRTIKQLTIEDSLDFEYVLDETERRLLWQNLSNEEKRRKILEHRIALGLVNYPNAATYLIKNYEDLAGRVFEEKTMREYNKMWYEYHRKRTPQIIRKPRLVGPRLLKTPRFAFDGEGFLPRDSVVVILPKNVGKFKKLLTALGECVERRSTEEDALLYLLAFLNSRVFNDILRQKVSKKRGGYPIVDEKLLRKLRIPIPSKESKALVKELLTLVKKLVSGELKKEYESRVDQLVEEIFNLQEK